MNTKQFCRIWSLALTAVLLFSIVASAAETGPVFVRIQLGKAYLYVYFKGEEMRIATSVKTLKDAEVITATQKREAAKGGAFIYFPETTLPIPEKALPFGAAKMMASFVVQESTSKVYATLSLSVKDKEESEWTYKWQVTRGASKSPTSSSPINLPDLKQMSLKVVTQGNSKMKKVAVGLHFKAGNTEIAGVYKDGSEVKAHVAIINAKGEETASEDGPVSLYGFG